METIGPGYFSLTLKGTEELSARTYRLDIKLRSLLVLIQKSSPTVEGIVQKSIFPRDETIERLRGLLNEQFVTLGAATELPIPSSPGQSASAGGPATAAPPYPVLDPGISLTQARFGLCDFFLDAFGVEAQRLIDAVNGATDTAGLQRVLDELVERMRKSRRTDLLANLLERVRAINEARI